MSIACKIWVASSSCTHIPQPDFYNENIKMKLRTSFILWCTSVQKYCCSYYTFDLKWLYFKKICKCHVFFLTVSNVLCHDSWAINMSFESQKIFLFNDVSYQCASNIPGTWVLRSFASLRVLTDCTISQVVGPILCISDKKW